MIFLLIYFSYLLGLCIFQDKMAFLFLPLTLWCEVFLEHMAYLKLESLRSYHPRIMPYLRTFVGESSSNSSVSFHVSFCVLIFFASMNQF